MLSRRETLIGGICALLGIAWRPASAQAPWGGVSLEGKTALVTGSTSGLGREVARRLGALGASVIVHGRDRERGNEVVQAIREEGSGSAVFYRADLASLDDVRALAGTVRANHEGIDILINNAGIGTATLSERRTSADGYELGFAVNYLSHFLLTRELLPLIERSAPARIVNVSSLGQAPIDFDDVMMTEDYSARRSYSQSKLAQILFTIELAERLDPEQVTVNSLHPATFMDTPLVRRGGREPMSTVDEGAEAVMQLAVSSELEGRTALFFNGLEEARANEQAYDEQARERLWQLSAELTQSA